MKVIFLTNNEISNNLVNWLIYDAAENVVVIGEVLSDKTIELHEPDLIISYNYRYIIKEDVIRLMPNKIINLHISLLPWNRGAHPNLWSFLEDTPKGVTIHVIDAGIDTGDILLQKEVLIEEAKETLKSSYNILHQEIQQLFKYSWNKMRKFEITPRPQPFGGSVHYKKDFERIRHLFQDEGWDIPIIELKRKYENLLGE